MHLLKQNLSRLTPGSKAHTKLQAEVKRLEGEWSSSGGQRVRHTFNYRGTTGYGGHHYTHFNDGMHAAWNPYSSQAFRKSMQGAGVGLGGVVAGSLAFRKVAKTSKKLDSEDIRITKNRRNPIGHKHAAIRKRQRLNTTALFGTMGTVAGGLFSGNSPKDALRHISIGTASGLGVGYGLARYAHPTNTMHSREWVTYTRRSHAGPMRQVRRKNPYYGKQGKQKAKSAHSRKAKVGR